MSMVRKETSTQWQKNSSSGAGTGGTVPNNTPLGVEVSNLILTFPK